MAFLVIASVVGLATFQDEILVEKQFVDVNQFSSEVKTITVELTDGIGSGDMG